MRTFRRGLLNTLGLAVTLGALCAPVCAHAGGLVAAWGDNGSGQTIIPQGLGPVKAVAAGGNHNLALKADGTIVSMGWDPNCDFGQCGAPPGLSNVVMLAASEDHDLALKPDGTVFSWGLNDFGQTGTPAGLSNVTAVAAGGIHSVALKADGTVVAWGHDQWGQCSGLAGLSNITAVAAGGNHSLALKADGTVAACGQNFDGQCIVPPGLTDVTVVAAGGSHSLALKANGTVVGWGANLDGQIDVPAGLSNVKAIVAGAYHSLALRADGTVVAWGRNDYGQGTVPAGLANVTAIAAGLWHNVAVASEGPLQILRNPASQEVPWRTNVTFSVAAAGAAPLNYQWFFNGQPLANTGRIAGATSPNLTILAAEFADIGTYVVVVSNSFGSMFSTVATLLVTNPPIITQQPSAQTMGAGADYCFMVAADGTPPLAYQWLFNGVPVAGATNNLFWIRNVQSINAGSYAAVISNAYGSVQSSNAVLTVTDRAPYIVRPPVPQTALLGRGVTFSVAAIGSLPMTYQWRFNGNDIPGATGSVLVLERLRYDQTGFYNVVVRNAFGEIISAKASLSVVQVCVWGDMSGDATSVHINPYAPTNVPPELTNLVAIAAGDSHVLALKPDGKVGIWASSYLVSPYNCVTNIPAGVSNVAAIAAGGFCNLVVRSNGTVVAWGYSSRGPVTNVPSGLSNVIAVAAGGDHCLTLRSNGTVIGWGSLPMATVPGGLSNIIAIAAGLEHSLALRMDGTVTAWGNNHYGQITVPSGLSNIIAIAAGMNHSLALRSDGTVVAWGAVPAQAVVAQVDFSNVVALASGGDRGFALRADGSFVLAGWRVPPVPPGLSNVIAIAAGGPALPLNGPAGFYVALVGNGLPVMTLQPVSQTTARGATVRLHARAVGVQPMSCQWQVNGQDLVGATNASLILTNVQGANGGAYRLVAGNALGQATSRTATLTIPYSATLATALNATNLMWKTGISNTAWFVQNRVTHDGEGAAQSGPIGNSQQSFLQTTVIGPGTLRFWWKVSSEEGFDLLQCYQDGSSNLLASVSGETGWEQETFAIPAGPHTLKWLYIKDATVSDGQDAAWVDQVSFGPNPPAIAMQPLGLTSPAGADVVLAVMATGTLPLTYQWLKGGLGLAGATQSRLLLPKVGRRDAGVYAVRVNNPWGSTLSSNASLFVRVPQRLGAPALLPDGSLSFRSGDADGGSVRAEDLMGFEAQASTNLTGWLTLTNALIWRNGSLWLRDPDRASYPRRFYRVLEH